MKLLKKIVINICLILTVLIVVLCIIIMTSNYPIAKEFRSEYIPATFNKTTALEIGNFILEEKFPNHSRENTFIAYRPFGKWKVYSVDNTKKVQHYVKISMFDGRIITIKDLNNEDTSITTDITEEKTAIKIARAYMQWRSPWLNFEHKQLYAELIDDENTWLIDDTPEVDDNENDGGINEDGTLNITFYFWGNYVELNKSNGKIISNVHW